MCAFVEFFSGPFVSKSGQWSCVNINVCQILPMPNLREFGQLHKRGDDRITFFREGNKFKSAAEREERI